MKKTLLLAGVACIFSYNANAMNISSDLKPYIGLDYVYSKADFKGEASRLEKSNLLKDNYNSGVINAGIKLGDYTSLEAFYQQSATRKGDRYYVDGLAHKAKTKFNAYGLAAVVSTSWEQSVWPTMPSKSKAPETKTPGPASVIAPVSVLSMTLMKTGLPVSSAVTATSAPKPLTI